MKLFRQPLFVIITFTLVLIGCGQKGPLTLPKKQTPPIITKPTTTKHPVQTETDDKNSTTLENNQDTTQSENNETPL